MNNYDEYSFEDKPKRKRSDDPTTWGQAWMAIGQFVVLAVSLGVVGNIIQQVIFADRNQRYVELLTTGVYSNNPAGPMVDLYSSPVSTVIAFAINMVIWIICLLIIHGLVHFFAMRMNGLGTLPGLIVRSKTWMLISYCLFFIAAVLTNMILVNSVLDYANLNAISGSQEAIQDFSSYVSGQSQIFSGVALLVWLIWGIGLSNVVGKYYQFGQGKGCLAVTFTNLVLGVCFCAISIGLGFLMFSFVQSYQ